jgi:CHAD domain-containing protein
VPGESFPENPFRPRVSCRKLLEPYCREVVRLRLRVLSSAGVDPVHDLRVASRRLQEALSFLEPFLPEEPHRRLHRRSRRIRRSLGAIRNADVTLKLATGLARRLPPMARKELDPFIVRLKAEAAGLRRRTIRGDGIPIPGIRRRIARILRADGRFPQVSLDRQGESILDSRLQDLKKALEASSRSTPEAMHRLRIAVKRYRYALEFLEKSGREDLKNDVEEARNLQGSLGRLHDLDVLLQIVRQRRAVPKLPPWVARLARERKGQLARAREVLKRSSLLWARLGSTPFGGAP